MRHVLIAAAALALVALLEAAFHLYRWRDERARDELQRRLKSLGDEAGGPRETLLRQASYASSPALDAFLRSVPFTDRVERLLEQSDSRFTVAQICGYSLLTASAGLVCGLLVRAGPVMTATSTVLGLAVPALLLVAARDRRSRKLSEQLPEALDMVARSLRAGHALSAAFELVASEMPEPVAVEFGRVFESQRLGIAVDRAIMSATERLPKNRDLKIFSVSVMIQKETGGNLAEILSQLAETIRARYRFHGKLRSLTAEGRASAVVVGAMPFVAGVLLRLANPPYLVPLVATPAGRGILLVAFASWAIGVTWLYRMTQLDV